VCPSSCHQRNLPKRRCYAPALSQHTSYVLTSCDVVWLETLQKSILTILHSVFHYST
jgi:hypothetical protein